MTVAPSDADARRARLAGNLEQLEQRIAEACAAAGRRRDEITVVVVTKFFPASDVRLLHDLGVRHVGENRHQEAAAKHAECRDLDLTWHFIGGLQSNKAAAVGAWADVVHSIDRARLLTGLSRAAHERDRLLDVLVQVSLDDEHAEGAGAGRSGVPAARVLDVVGDVLTTPGLRLRGVMGVAPLGGDASDAFRLLGQVAAEVRDVEPGATWISAGMSGDLEQAIACGATHVRVGTAVLGNRPTRG